MAIANDSSIKGAHDELKHHGAGRYWVIRGALLVLTLVTVITGRMELPTFGLALALVIATTKGALVAFFFMHLSEHQGVNRLFFAVSILFVVLMLIAPLADVGTRFRYSNPPGSQYSDLQPVDIGAGPQQGRFGGLLKQGGTADPIEPPAP